MRHNPVFFLLWLALGIPGRSHALLGEYLPENPPWSCQLVRNLRYVTTGPGFKSWNHIRLTNCSGSVVDDYNVVTAKHCMEPSEHEREQLEALESRGFETGLMIDVECPGRSPYVVDWQLHPTKDLAVLQVHHTLAMEETVRLPKDAEEVKELEQAPHRCSVLGWGVDNNGETGNSRSVRMRPHNLESMSQAFSGSKPEDLKKALEPRYYLPDHPLRPGDSGGGMACTQSDGKSVLLGVNEGMMERAKLGVGVRFEQADIDWLKESIKAPDQDTLRRGEARIGH